MLLSWAIRSPCREGGACGSGNSIGLGVSFRYCLGTRAGVDDVVPWREQPTVPLSIGLDGIDATLLNGTFEVVATAVAYPA